MDTPLSTAERAIAAGERAMYPHYSYCQRCMRPWAVVTPHTVSVTTMGGCFALCERCHELLTPQERLVYAKQAWIKWWSSEPWEPYRAAILHERLPVNVGTYEEALALVKSRPDYYRRGVTSRDGVWTVYPKLPPEVVQAWLDNGVVMPDEERS